MDKESIKKIINDIIDSVDEIHDFSITNDTVDLTTLDDKSKNVQLTGFTNIYITQNLVLLIATLPDYFEQFHIHDSF